MLTCVGSPMSDDSPLEGLAEIDGEEGTIRVDCTRLLDAVLSPRADTEAWVA